MLEYIKNFIVKLDSKEDVVKALLYLKLFEKGIKLTNNDLGVLSLFVWDSSIKAVANKAIEKEYKHSVRSVENTISELLDKELLDNIGIGLRAINKSILPNITGSQLAIDCKIYNGTK
jgi:hypothetical protein